MWVALLPGNLHLNFQNVQSWACRGVLFWTRRIQLVPLNKSWNEYNESLIERGRILMDIGFLGSSNSLRIIQVQNTNRWGHSTDLKEILTFFPL